MLEFKFDKIEVNGEVSAHYTFDTPEMSLSKFTVVASPKGVKLMGESQWFFTVDDCQSLARIIGEAFSQHTTMKKRIITDGS